MILIRQWQGDVDLRCCMLAGIGMSTQMIGEQTGLSPGQIAYRLKQAGIKRSDYRNGTSDVAHRMLDYVPTSKAAIRGLLQLNGVKK